MQHYLFKTVDLEDQGQPEFQSLAKTINQVESNLMAIRDQFFSRQIHKFTAGLKELEDDLLQLRFRDKRSNYESWLMQYYLMTDQVSKAEKILDEWISLVNRKGCREGDWGPIAGITQHVRSHRHGTIYLEIAAMLQSSDKFYLVERFYAFLEKMIHGNKKNFTDKQFKLLSDILAFLPERAETLAERLLPQTALIP